MNIFMNNSQHIIDLLNLSFLFLEFEFILLKKTLVLCLSDEKTILLKFYFPKFFFNIR